MPPFETVNCGCAPEPCQPPPHHPQTGQNWLSDNLLMCLLALAVVVIGVNFVIKAGVKGGILKLLNDPNYTLSKLLGGGECR